MARNFNATALDPMTVGCAPACPPGPTPAPISPIISVRSVNGENGDIVLKKLYVGDKEYNGSNDIQITANDLGLAKACVYEKAVGTREKVLEYLTDAKVGDLFFCNEDKMFYLSVGEGDYKMFPSRRALEAALENCATKDWVEAQKYLKEADLTKFSLVDETGNKLELDIDEDYTITASLYNKNDVLISESSIDLPLEDLVKDGYYDTATKEIVLVLQNGREIRIPVGSLVGELATKAELAAHIADFDSHVTEEEKALWTAKQDKLSAGENVTIANGIISAKDTIYNDTEVRNLISTETEARIAVDANLSTDIRNLNTAVSTITTDVDNLKINKQDKLTAGANVQINGTTISATDTQYSAGENITIVDNVISSTASGNLKEAITVQTAIGAIAKGEVLPVGTSLETIIRRMLAATPAPTTADIYCGGLVNHPASETDINQLTKSTVNTNDLITGVAKTIAVDEKHVVIAYKTSIGNIVSITEGGFECISDFTKFTFGEYTFYSSSDQVYDPEAEIQYVIKWEIN